MKIYIKAKFFEKDFQSDSNPVKSSRLKNHNLKNRGNFESFDSETLVSDFYQEYRLKIFFAI